MFINPDRELHRTTPERGCSRGIPLGIRYMAVQVDSFDKGDTDPEM